MSDGSQDATVQIIWILNKEGNTGTGGGLGSLIGGQCAQFLGQNRTETPTIKPKKANLGKLAEWCKENGFIEHKCDLLAKLGLHLRCFAQRYKRADEHKGKNNVIATYLTCYADTGLARDTILGKAAFVRTTPEGQPVDFDVKELLRCLLFVNDMMSVYEDSDNYDRTTSRILPRVIHESAAVFPYYWWNDTFRGGGFNYTGLDAEETGKEDRYCCARSLPDGSVVLDKNPQDMAMAETFML